MEKVNLSRLADEIFERQSLADENEWYDEVEELENVNGDIFSNADEADISKRND